MGLEFGNMAAGEEYQAYRFVTLCESGLRVGGLASLAVSRNDGCPGAEF
jgi:hypothetical protein